MLQNIAGTLKIPSSAFTSPAQVREHLFGLLRHFPGRGGAGREREERRTGVPAGIRRRADVGQHVDPMVIISPKLKAESKSYFGGSVLSFEL
jgi:hypothetical protein